MDRRAFKCALGEKRDRKREFKKARRKRGDSKQGRGKRKMRKLKNVKIERWIEQN